MATRNALLPLLVALLSIHVGLAITDANINYWGRGVGERPAQILSGTPIGHWLSEDDDKALQNPGEVLDPSAFSRILTFAVDLSLTVRDFTTFNYSFLQVGEDAGIFYLGAIALRVMAFVLLAATYMAAIYFLFDSGIINSKLGLALVASGAAVGGLAWAGTLAKDAIQNVAGALGFGS